MKERPILFNSDMVRAILDGRKTQTRRVLKPQPTLPVSHFRCVGHEVATGRGDWQACDKSGNPVHAFPGIPGCVTEIAKCPYGQPGDRLWVREAFALLGNEDGVCIDWNGAVQKGSEQGAARIYRASCKRGDYGLWEIPDAADWKPDTDAHNFEGAWRPSVHMPRWASRIQLEIVSVRVERLKIISEADAKKEGAFFTDYGRLCFHRGAPAGAQDCREADKHHPQRNGWSMYQTGDTDQCLPSPRMAFAGFWESINGANSWDENPWVWAIEFKQVEEVANDR